MKKLIRIRVPAVLCLFFSSTLRKLSSRHSSARQVSRPSDTELLESMHHFFSSNPPETVRYFTLLILQCWVLNDCKLKAEVTDTNFEDFLNQLNALIASAHHYYARQRAEVVIAA